MTVRLEPLGRGRGRRAARRASDAPGGDAGAARAGGGRQPALCRGARRAGMRRRAATLGRRSPTSLQRAARRPPRPARRPSARRARAGRGRGRALPPRRGRRADRRPTRRRSPAELDELARKDLIRPPRRASPASVAYRFKHILVRDAAYRATTKKLRADAARAVRRLARAARRRPRRRVPGDPRLPPRAGLPLPDASSATRRDAGARGARRPPSRGRAAAAPTPAATIRPPPSCSDRALAPTPGRDGRMRSSLRRAYAGALNRSGGQRARGARNHAGGALRLLPLSATAGSSRRANAPHESDLRGPERRPQRLSAAIAEEGFGICAELGDEVGLAVHERQLGLICRLQGRVAEAANWLEQALVHLERRRRPADPPDGHADAGRRSRCRSDAGGGGDRPLRGAASP